MTLIKLTKDSETLYFSTKAKVARYLSVFNQSVDYALRIPNKLLKGWNLEYTDDPNILNGQIDTAQLVDE